MIAPASLIPPAELPVDDEYMLSMLQVTDAEARYHIFNDDPRRFDSFRYSDVKYTPGMALTECVRAGQHRADGTAANYGLRYLGNMLVGGLDLTLQHPDPRVANLAYMIMATHEGRGAITRGARVLVRFGLEDWGLHSVVLPINADNQRSQAVAARLGATKIGVTPKTEHGPAKDIYEIREISW